MKDSSAFCYYLVFCSIKEKHGWEVQRLTISKNIPSFASLPTLSAGLDCFGHFFSPAIPFSLLLSNAFVLDCISVLGSVLSYFLWTKCLLCSYYLLKFSGSANLEEMIKLCLWGKL